MGIVTSRWAQLAADLIPAGAAVVEFGPGSVLEKMLPDSCRYRASKSLGDWAMATSPADLDNTDVIAILEGIERVADLEPLLDALWESKAELIVRLDANQQSQIASIEAPALRSGRRLVRSEKIDDRSFLAKFARGETVAAEGSRLKVGVISFFNEGNFGDRLGYHIINPLLPGRCDVEHISFWNLARNTSVYDLVIVGMGNSVFGPFLNEHLFRLVESARAAVGIFGTQYRQNTERSDMVRLVDRLDTWFARSEEDIFIYGRDKSNVVYLGDWLMLQFPMSTPTDNTPLTIGQKDTWNDDVPLDRRIQNIQRHKVVFSTALHPLLCALTSADMVGYTEQQNEAGTPSGKFRSLLLDIFDRSYPERQLFRVERDKVARYKSKVHANAAAVGRRLTEIIATLK